MGVLGDIVCVYKLLGGFVELDIGVLWAFKQSSEVEFLNLKAPEFGALSGEDDVDQELEKFQGCCVGPCVPGVSDTIASDYDSGEIGVFFFGEHLSDNGCVCDILTLVMWVVVKQDEMEGVSTRHLLDLDILSNSHYFAESPHFIGENSF